MARTACIFCLASTANGCSKNLGLGSASSGHITNLKQSILFLLISMEASFFRFEQELICFERTAYLEKRELKSKGNTFAMY